MNNLIDVHTHIAAFPTEENGCFMSPHFQKGFQAKLVIWKLGLKGNTPQEINKSYVHKLVGNITRSTRVKKAVVLALDGIYDSNGDLDKNKTHMLVSNDFMFRVVAEHPDLFFPGASVNPQRKDAIDELNKVIEKGAKLIKVLPNSQNFDPMDKKYLPFFRILADKKIPILSHVGYEFTVTAGSQELGRASRLQMALEEGVTVIAAHAGSSGIFLQGSYYKEFIDLLNKYPHFYADLSAITLPNRARMASLLKKHPEYFDRYLFGSDYPLSAYATPFLGQLGIKAQWRLWRTKNIFDKQAEILERLGFKINPETTLKILKINS